MRFAEFDVDPAAGVLTRNNVRVKLQDLPFRLLVALMNRPGVVISREELRSELWGAETFVDAEAGLNTAIGKLREALQDHADAPRFIETVPKRGYRFIGTIADAPAQPDAVAATTPDPRTGFPFRRRVLVAAAIVAAAVLGFAGYQAYSTTDRVTVAVVRFHNETGDVDHDRLAGTLTDAVVVSLAQNQRLAIIGNSPILRTERIFEDVGKISKALSAEYVVLGQVQQGDRGLLVRAHFIRAADGKHLWADKIDLAGISETERQVTSLVDAGVTKGLERAGARRF